MKFAGGSLRDVKRSIWYTIRRRRFLSAVPARTGAYCDRDGNMKVVGLKIPKKEGRQ